MEGLKGWQFRREEGRKRRSRRKTILGFDRGGNKRGARDIFLDGRSQSELRTLPVPAQYMVVPYSQSHSQYLYSITLSVTILFTESSKSPRQVWYGRPRPFYMST